MKRVLYFAKRIFGASISKKVMFSVALLIMLSVFLVGYSSFSVAKSIIESKTRQYIEDILSQTAKNIEMRLNRISDIAFYLCNN